MNARILEALKKIEKLSLEQVKGRNWCGVELATRSYTYTLIQDDLFRITLWNDGFEATRNLSLGELEAIRDWATAALAAVSNQDAAA